MTSKLTLVSIMMHGRRVSKFVTGYIGANGKTFIPKKTYEALQQECCGFDIKHSRGMTITIG